MPCETKNRRKLTSHWQCYFYTMQVKLFISTSREAQSMFCMPKPLSKGICRTLITWDILTVAKKNWFQHVKYVTLDTEKRDIWTQIGFWQNYNVSVLRDYREHSMKPKGIFGLEKPLLTDLGLVKNPTLQIDPHRTHHILSAVVKKYPFEIFILLDVSGYFQQFFAPLPKSS